MAEPLQTDADSGSEAQDPRFDLVLLDASRVRLFRTGGSSVRATISAPDWSGRTYLSVKVARAFPLSNPKQYIGIRDDDDKDIGMIKNPGELDPDSLSIVSEELDRRYFLPRVDRVRAVKEEFGLTTWEVETDRGTRTFWVRNLRESIQNLSPTRLLLTDIDGNRWEFADIGALDRESARILERAT